MPIVTADNKPLSTKDVQALKDMLRQSVTAHASYLEGGDYEKWTTKNVKKSKQVLADVFKKASEDVNKEVDKAIRKGPNVSVETFIDDFYSNLMSDIIKAVEKNKKDFSKGRDGGELSYLQGFISEFGIPTAREYAGEKVHTEDTDKGYELSESTFQLPKEPVKGIEDIDDYNPITGRVQILYEARSGNSGTLQGANVEARIRELEKVPENNQRRRAAAQERLQNALKSTTGLHAGGEMARIYSSELMNNKNVSFADLYDVFTGLNRSVRIGDNEGGYFRASGITAGKIAGVGTFTAPKAVYKTLTKIADCMNMIKQTDDPALRKTQALQLASYAYAMTISEHVFGDGNGRTCRLFADTILQTFGLPPHTPLPGLMDVPDTLGRGKLDFNNGAEVLFEGIKLSNEKLQKEKADKESARISFKNLEDSLNKSGLIKRDKSDNNLINNNIINDNFINDPARVKKADELEEKIAPKQKEIISFDNLEEKKISINDGNQLIKREKLRYTGNPEAPRFDDIRQLEWVKKLGEKAEKSRGRLSDSDTYLKFLGDAMFISDLAEQISLRNGLGMGDDVIIPTSSFKDYTKKLFPGDKVITVKQAKEMYTKVWNDLVKNAKEYEKNKIEVEGFTRNVNNKDKQQLRSRSKMKFDLMDEIFEPQKRMTAAAKKK